MSSFGSPSPFFIAGTQEYQVKRSLRFNDDNSAYLNRTPSSTSNRKTFTISWWFKIGNIPASGTFKALFGAYDNSTSGDNGYWLSSIFDSDGLGIIVFLLLIQLNQLLLIELKFMLMVLKKQVLDKIIIHRKILIYLGILVQ